MIFSDYLGAAIGIGVFYWLMSHCVSSPELTQSQEARILKSVCLGVFGATCWWLVSK